MTKKRRDAKLNPNSIKISQTQISLKVIYEMIMGKGCYNRPILDLFCYQRKDEWDNITKSRFIESILLQIPLPALYLARDEEGYYQVIDGAQRLLTIRSFLSNEFKLTNLEYLKEECENKYFQKQNAESLHPKFVRGLKFYQVDCNIIDSETPHEVRLNIFKRLNTTANLSIASDTGYEFERIGEE